MPDDLPLIRQWSLLRILGVRHHGVSVREMAQEMGRRGQDHVRTNFLMTRQIRDYLSVWYSLERKGKGKGKGVFLEP